MRFQSVRWLMIGASIAVASPTSAATFTLGAGNGSEADGTYIASSLSGGNYGSNARYWMGGDFNALLNWPAVKDSIYGRTVDACTLFVMAKDEVLNLDGVFACFQIRTVRDWVEMQATWNNYKTSTAWGTSGANNTTSDIYSTAVDPKFEVDFSNGVYTPFDITSIAKQWDGTDTANCRGVVLKQYGGSDPTEIDLASDDHTMAGNRPKIKVVYHEGIDSRTPARRRKSVISLIHEFNLNKAPLAQTKDRP